MPYTEGMNLLPAERIALIMARSQLERGENPPINTTTAVVLGLDRLASEALVLSREEAEALYPLLSVPVVPTDEEKTTLGNALPVVERLDAFLSDTEGL